MSAITPLIEYGEHKVATDNTTEEGASLSGGDFALGDLGKLKDLPPLASSHANLTRTVWIRRLLERALSQRVYTLEQCRQLNSKGKPVDAYGEMVFKLNRPLDQREIPWMAAAFESYSTFALWGEAAKMACVAQGTRIHVQHRGLIPIEDVVAGDEVLTRQGWRKVTAARRTGDRPTLRIVTAAGYVLRVTGDHLVASKPGWVKGKKPAPCRRGEIEWRRAEELEPGWFVEVAPEGLPIDVVGDAGAFDVGALLGYCCGDGTFAQNGRIAIDVGAAKWGDLDQLAAIATKHFGAEPHWGEYRAGRGQSAITSTSLMRRVYWECTALTKFFNAEGFGFGVKSPRRRVPESVFKGSSQLVLGFLSGLFSSDGCVAIRPSGRIVAELDTTSVELARGVQLLLSAYGARTSITTHRPGRATRGNHLINRVNLLSTAALNILRNAKLINPHKRKLLGEPVVAPPSKRLVRVEVIEDDGLVVPVYDLSVEGIPEFVAGGLVVHNCPTWDLPAGGLEVGGACPGADAGQSVISYPRRAAMLRDASGGPFRGCGQPFLPNPMPGFSARLPLHERNAICSLCVAGDTLILVRGEGLVPIAQLANRGIVTVWSGKGWRETQAVFNGVKPTVLVTMMDGRTLRCTDDHEFITAHGRVAAGKLTAEMELPWECPDLSPRPHAHVASVVATGKEEPVFDLVNVGPEHQFTANGISVSNCYATAGNYPSPHVQAGEILRYWWCRSMIPNRRAEWVDTIVRSMQLIRYPLTRQGILPVRIHSSGDFFSPEYAAAWIEVANRLWQLDRRITLWAPTRTWAAPGWEGVWPRLLKELVSLREFPARPNFSIRASAYHVGDHAPGMLGEGSAMGTTSLLTPDDTAMDDPRRWTGPKDNRRDFDCQVYALGKDAAHNCDNAIAPDGQRGCRACWVDQRLRVSYTTH